MSSEVAAGASVVSLRYRVRVVLLRCWCSSVSISLCLLWTVMNSGGTV